jgi:hypothetical protein
MGEMNIKLDDQHLLEGLSEMAKAHNRSIETEVIELLQKAVKERSRGLERIRTAERIAAMTPPDRKQTDSVLMIREDRDR